MKVLVTGANGQLGKDLVATLAASHDVRKCGHDDLDVTNADAIRNEIAKRCPDVVINCAAWTDVDGCESDPMRAFAVNGVGPLNLTAALNEFGGRLVQISTDYVFDGKKDGPYFEDDEPNPLSVYGASKLYGETVCRPTDTIIRTSTLIGLHRSNILSKILDQLATQETVRVVEDQRSCPTFTQDLAPTIRLFVEDHYPGVFHITNNGVASRYEFACAVAQTIGVDPARVVPIQTIDTELVNSAPRPTNSALQNHALEATGIPLLPNYRDTLNRMIRLD